MRSESNSIGSSRSGISRRFWRATTMANPLRSADNCTGGGDLKPGETRTILAKDKQGNIVKTMTLYRTDREYVYDLCDCYNAHRTEEAKERGVEWYVAPNG